jgi:hypothetical protein
MRCAPRLVAVLAAVPLPAFAAEVTRIASSFEPDDPFGMFLDVSFVRDQHKGEIAREVHQGGDVQELPELRYLMVDNRLAFDLRIGLWQDVEIKYSIPIIFALNQSWGFAGGNDAVTSTIINNCLQPDGVLRDSTCLATGAGQLPIFDVPNESFRGGIGNMHFGLSYALFNERKDRTKPTWLLGIDYEAPTAELRNPSVTTASDDRGEIGDRIHRYTFFTAFSKRLGLADPYFKLQYTAAARGPGWYSNCDTPSALNMSVPSNCRTGAWTREETGIRPPQTAGVLFGSEFNVHEIATEHQRVAIDLRTVANYVSQGRYYNPLTDVLGKLLVTGDYLEVGGALGITAQASEYLVLKATSTVLYGTDRTLTDERIGKDLSGDGQVALDNVAELNPNFDYRYDMVSRRFRLKDSFTFRLDISASFVF